MELPYFNPIRNTIIDPMHNLFLGTSKHCMELWTQKGIISRSDFAKMEERMSRLSAPHSMGRLPLKIASGFSGFTADQWRNWTICYSVIVLRGILPREHLQYWLLFVKACTLLCTRCLYKNYVNLADQYLVLFCKKFEEVNGKEACTPNMHLHLHLRECLNDYGPVYAFWCFAFERYNGILGSFPTNQRNVEPQLMRKCLILQELHSQTFPDEGEVFKGILCEHSTCFTGGLMMMSDVDMLEIAKFSAPVLYCNLDFTVTKNERCLPPLKHIVLDNEKTAELEHMYNLLYPELLVNNICRFAKQSSRVSFANEVYGSTCTSRGNNIIVFAYWSNSAQGEDHPLPLSVGQIQFFIKHILTTTQQVKKEHILAYICWYRNHQHYDWFGSSAVVCHNEFESESFIPVQRLASLCVYGTYNLQLEDNVCETVLVVTPVHNKHLLN